MDDPIVHIDSGSLKGKIIEYQKNQPVYAFLGIPYAKPPIGDLRFKAPQPAEPWDGIRNATEPGNPCYQKDLFFTHSIIGSEDCLYLNVLTKNINNPSSLSPVMVFIHGGAFLTGSGDPIEFTSPIFLMREDIVYVSINYRLGVLGFLSLNDTSLGVPGNAGMKDQVLALKWVKNNIEKFGGDPNNVTIFGVSAGAASVNYLLLSPSSNGLFHKAILQSGSVLNPWPHLHPKSLDILKYLKIEHKEESEILAALLKVPAKDLIEAQSQLYKDLKNSTFRLFAPCVEKPNDTEFLTRNPIDVITSGNYNKVPTIIGYNSNEGLYAASSHFNVDLSSDEIFIPQQVVLPNDGETKKKLIEKIKIAYQFDKNPDNKFLAVSDSTFIAGIIALVQNFATTNPEPLYLYEFNLVASNNFLRRLLGLGDRYQGACHGDELGYLFESPMNKSLTTPGTIEDVTINRLVKWWTNFARHGNPTPDESQFGLKWTPVEKDRLFYLNIEEKLFVRCNPNVERMALWREIYKASKETELFMP